MYFISSRPGANAFSQYNFVFLTAIDVLSQYPTQVEAFLRDIRPSSAGSIPPHPLDRCHDLFFLNTAEHFTIILASELNEELLINAATPYLGLGSDKRLLEIFEAAHSVMLAVLSAPQNSDVLSRYIRPYVDVLFKVFPQNLSARQFRIAIKTLVRITSPPAPISQTQPLLPSILLDLVRLRLETASSGPLQQAAEATTPKVFKEDGFEQSNLTEQSVLVLTLTDALSFLPTEQLEDWLPIVADSMNTIENLDQQHKCKQRFWEVLSNGGMDVDRAAICVTWWGTRGGRDSVIINRNHQTEGPFMSGGRGETSKL